MNIQKILQDVYSIDPSLQEHEEDLKKAIKAMLEKKPKIEQDEHFQEQLLHELLEYSENFHSSSFNSFLMKKLTFLFGGVAVIALLVTPILYKDSFLGIFPKQESSSVQIADIPSDMTEEFDFSVDNGSSVQTEEAMVGGRGGGGAVMDKMASSIMPYPPQYGNYGYTYTGEDLSLTEDSLPILKQNEIEQSFAVDTLLPQFNLGLIQLQAFDNLQIENINFSENKDDAYSVSLNVKNGYLSVHKNSWGDLEEGEKIKEFNLKALNEGDVVKIADAFIKQYGINLENYGEGELRESIAVILERDYQPEVLQVIYPLLIDGKKVFTNYGEPIGVNVSVNVRRNIVIGLYGLQPYTYTKKNYPATTDFEQIKSILEKKGESGFVFEESEDQDMVQLHSPYEVWMQYSSYRNNKNTIYLVPALAFEADYPKNYPAYGQQQKTIVPLAKDMVEKLVGEK